MADRLSVKQRSYCMSQIRSSDTLPELVVRKKIWHMGFRYRLHDKMLPGKPDIVIKKHKIVVLVNGCFWHQHKKCSRSFLPKSNRRYWLPKLGKNVSRDKENEAKLKKLGWKVVKIWECEVNRSDNFLDQLLLKKLSIVTR